MKSKILFIPLAIASFYACTASAASPIKQVNIPFSNEPILSKDHEGIAFAYDMTGNPGKKIVCKLSNIYKSWFEYPDQGAYKESGVFGGYQTVVFTNKGHDAEPSEDYSIYHADVTGNIKVGETSHKNSSNATASCFYSADNSSN